MLKYINADVIPLILETCSFIFNGCVILCYTDIHDTFNVVSLNGMKKKNVHIFKQPHSEINLLLTECLVGDKNNFIQFLCVVIHTYIK